MVKYWPIIAGLGAVAVVALIAMEARAGEPQPPPGGYECPYCGLSFDSYEELAYHVQTSHQGERIPLPIEWE
jgi:hypothetical protein